MKTIVTHIGSNRFYPRPEGKWNVSVTTILSATFPKSKFLIDWQIEKGKEEAEKILMEAAEEGQIIHQYIESLLQGAALNVEIMSDKQRKCVAAFIKWYEAVKPKIIAVEQQTHCDELGFSGTIDLIAEINGEPWVIDLKTSNAIHDSYHAQVGAYAYSWSSYMTETGQVKAAILHLNSKTKQGYTWAKVDVEWGWKMFKLCRDMFYHMNPTPSPKMIEYPATFQLEPNSLEQNREVAKGNATENTTI